MELQDNQKAEIKEAFDLFDKDGDGKVEGSSIGTILRSLGINPTLKEIEELEQEIETNEEGILTFQSFLTKVTSRYKEKDTFEDVEKAFRTFDPEDQGWVPTDELRELLTTIGEPLTKEEVDELIKEADPEETGKIVYKKLIPKMLEKIN
ncbi:ef-hand protein [Anaeramoeba flamelloides]|uniref:Ef-hand protein n=1 Tax=Anaeramoeba flamelloides TaxID=1746091 RepID=A0AAV7ZRP3_9EUKA|nr:ef-hand protein [Anaeramoeba flamelloides]KAJ6240567.1 ef-hand protein [Anaeramoeba flamelloides]